MSEEFNGSAFTWQDKEGNAMAIGVGKHPARKSVMLYGQHGGAIYPLAYFRHEDAARDAINLLEWLARARME